jgi:hypothetical protein
MKNEKLTNIEVPGSVVQIFTFWRVHAKIRLVLS